MGEFRTYHRQACAAFSSPNGEFGVLANFAHMRVTLPTSAAAPTAEHAFQVLKFRAWGVQHRILTEPNPKVAKQIARDSSLVYTKADWDGALRYAAMRYVLKMKLFQHWDTITAALQATGDRPIIELSGFDQHWGVKANEETGVLEGENMLGRMWMELRQQVRKGVLTRTMLPPLNPRLMFGTQPQVPPRRVIIAGSRDADHSLVMETIRSCPFLGTMQTVICGGARGADTFGADYARAHGLEVEMHPALWDAEGKSAGFRRNTRMAAVADALILAWSGESHGSAHMLAEAQAAGLLIHQSI